MPRQKKQHLKKMKDGRYFCRYKDKWFTGYDEQEVLEQREEYKRMEKSRGVVRSPMPDSIRICSQMASYRQGWCISADI